MSLDENMVAPVNLPINNLDGNLSGVNLNGHARIIMHKNSEKIRHANKTATRVKNIIPTNVLGTSGSLQSGSMTGRHPAIDRDGAVMYAMA